MRNDAVAAGHLTDLRTWWDMCVILALNSVFFDSSKAFVILKEMYLPMGRVIFEDKRILFTTEGRQYLDAAIGATFFVKSYVSVKMKE